MTARRLPTPSARRPVRPGTIGVAVQSSSLFSLTSLFSLVPLSLMVLSLVVSVPASAQRTAVTTTDGTAADRSARPAPTALLTSRAATRLFDFDAVRATAVSDCADSADSEAAPRVLVRFDGSRSPEEIEAELSAAGISGYRQISPLNLYLLDRDRSGTVLDRRQALDLLDRVRALPIEHHADLDCRGSGGVYRTEQSTTQDPWTAEQWHLDNPDGIDIDAPEAWAITGGSEQIVVGIVDSGTVAGHPELDGRIYQSPDDPINDTDDEGDGWKDDRSGWDFVADDELAEDEHNHGSWVSGMLAAAADNGLGVAGLDRAARIAPLKILDETNTGYTSTLVAALDYALAHPEIRIVNLSLVDFPDDPFLRAAIEALSTQAILVACAGNAGPGSADLQFPGAYPETISVAWTDREDQIAPASSSGSTVDVSAPGLDVVTIDPSSLEDGYQVVSGCSFATPLVTGALSLTLALRDATDTSDARFLLQRTVRDLGPAGWDEDFGWGRIDVDDLLTEAQSLVFQGDFESGDLSRWN